MKIFNIQNINIKFRNLVFIIIFPTIFGLSNSLWADTLEVEEKIILPAPSKAVWALIGGFHALDRWHPDVATSTMIGTGKQAGDVRVLTLHNNERIVEKLDTYDEKTMSLRYRILESPLPIENYAASLSVTSIDNNMTVVIWKSSFNAAGASKEEAKQIISGIYITGLQSLKNLFK